MSYDEQLKTPQWYAKRDQILERDAYCCQDCLRGKDRLSTFIQLQVHHKEYIDGLMAWEHPDNLLITLCRECHAKLHGHIDDFRPARLKPAFVYGVRRLESQPVLHISEVMRRMIQSIIDNLDGKS